MIRAWSDVSVIRHNISQRQVVLSMVFIPLIFGLLSMLAGQEMGWDFRNYHIYNAYSFLNERLSQDLSPAGFQSYFNPALDIPYYWMNEHMPAMAVGFVMGFIQGLVFIPVLGISLMIIEQTGGERWVAILVAIAGVVSAGFISQIRGVSGDNITTLFQLSALYIVLANIEGIKRLKLQAVLFLLIAGVVSGLGSGLKLTSVTASLAICFSLLFISQPLHYRIYSSFVFGVGVLVGLSISAGHWFYEMYLNFGNPLFPQFGSIFPSDIANPISIGDTRYLPQNITDMLLRPFVFLFEPQKLDGGAWPQIVWPVFYIVFLVWAALRLFKKGSINSSNDLTHEDRVRVVMAYVVTGFIIWMVLFSIHRYQFYFLMLAPLLIWVMLAQVAPVRFKKVFIWFAWASIALSLIIGLRSMGFNGWSNKAIWSDGAQFEIPADSSVIFVGEPMAWISVLFPKDVSILGIGNNFPTSAGYRDKAMNMTSQRKNLYAVFPLLENERLDSVNLVNAFLEGSFVTGTQSGCNSIKWILAHSRIHASLVEHPGNNQGLCRFGVADNDVASYAFDSQVLLSKQLESLSVYGYSIESALCEVNYGYIGKKKLEFNVCKLR